MFFFLLSGLFCCLGFLGVVFLLFGQGRVLFFAVWAGTRAPPEQQKKTRPRPNSKKKNTPPPKQQKKEHAPPLPSVLLFLLFGRGAYVFAV